MRLKSLTCITTVTLQRLNRIEFLDAFGQGNHLRVPTATYNVRPSPEGDMIRRQPNAGGNSTQSEAIAMDVLAQVYHAKHVWTEMRIRYHMENWKKADFITSIQGENVAVSVTRAYQPPLWVRSRLRQTTTYNHPDNIHLFISRLLEKKLNGLVVSRAGIIGGYNESNHNTNLAIARSILFAWSDDDTTSNVLRQTFLQAPDVLTDDVELIIGQVERKHLYNDFKHWSEEDTVLLR